MNGERRAVLKSIGIGATAGIAGLAGCVGGGGGDGRDITVAFILSAEHPVGQAVDNLNEDEELEEWDFTLTEIGGEEDQIDAGASGSVEMHVSSMGSLIQAFGMEYNFLASPFVYEDWDHFRSLMDEWVYGGEFNDQMIDQGGQRIMDNGATYGGARGFTSNEPVTSADDVQGVQLRVPQFDSWVQVWEEIGADVTPVAWDEVYQAVQTGVVEATEAPIGTIVDASLHEVQDYYSRIEHMYYAPTFVMNEDAWQSLSESDQDLLQEKIAEQADWVSDQVMADDEEHFGTVEDEGHMEVITPDEIDRESFSEAAASVIDAFYEEEWVASREEVESHA